jgi:hypothetical protein
MGVAVAEGGAKIAAGQIDDLGVGRHRFARACDPAVYHLELGHVGTLRPGGDSPALEDDGRHRFSQRPAGAPQLSKSSGAGFP